jgi:serine/threonine protein kinase
MKDGLPEWFKAKKLRKIKHNHLMPMLGAYQHGEIFFILMERAELTLGRYLKSEGTTFTPKELWEQVQGLAAGLASLHAGISGSLITYHKDLKPANILIVGKVMKISDFGLVEFKLVGPNTGDSRSSGVPDGHGYRPYAAPAPTDSMYTRSSDVWSLGAIISEIATFDIQKKEGVKQYRWDRQLEPDTGYTYGTESFHKDGKVKDLVLERHEILEKRVERSRSPTNREPLDPFQEHFYTAGFFPFIETMLQYRRPPQPGIPALVNPGVSPTAEQVANNIKEFCEKAEQGLCADASSYRPNQIPDIWDDINKGKLPDSESAATSKHRL